jgi:hypothetical protein
MKPKLFWCTYLFCIDKPTEEEEQTWRRNRYEQEAQLAAELKARIQLKNKVWL